jgi:hypothetical protein
MKKNSTKMFMIVIILRICEDFSSNVPSRNKFRNIDNVDILAAIQVVVLDITDMNERKIKYIYTCNY